VSWNASSVPDVSWLNAGTAIAKVSAAIAPAEDASLTVLLSKRRVGVHMRNLPGLFEFHVKSNIATFQPYGLFQQTFIKFL
jgi:hypothetical protein